MMRGAEEAEETQPIAAERRPLRIRLQTRITSRPTRACVVLTFATLSGSMACGRFLFIGIGLSQAGRSPESKARIAASRSTSQLERHELIRRAPTDPIMWRVA